MNLIDIYWFMGTFLIVYLLYLFFQVLGKKKKYDPNKVPVELAYIIQKYRLDMTSISYKKIMNQIGIASAFDIAFAGTFMFMFVKNIFFAILIGGIMLIPLIIITFNFIGKYYERRGLIINGNKKN